MKKISFTRVNKNYNDKLQDLINSKTTLKPVRKKNKNTGRWKNEYEIVKVRKRKGQGFKNVKRQKFEREGLKQLSKDLGIREKTILKLLDFGVDKKYNSKIQKQWKKLKVVNTKTQSLQFTDKNLTKENFFKPKKIRGLKGTNEMYYFRMGIYMEFENNTGAENNYIIHNLPIPSSPPSPDNTPIQTQSYIEGFNAIFESLQKTLQYYSSLKLWRINYFDVNIVDISAPLLKFKKGRQSKINYGGTKTRKAK